MANTGVQALIAKAKAHINKNEYERASAILKDALLSVDKQAPGNLKPRLEIMMLLADVNNLLGEWVDALFYLDAVVHSSTDVRFSAIAAEALISSGTILSKKGNWDVAMRKFKQAEMLADSERLWNIKGRALVSMGIIHWRQGDGEESIQLAGRAWGIGQEIEDHGLMGSSFALMASVKFDQADFGGAVEANEKALDHFRKTNELLETSRVLNNLGETYKLMGEYEKAIEQFDEGLKAIEKMGVKRNIGYLLMNLAECHVRQGKIKKAKLYAKQTSDTIKDQEDVYLQAYLSLVWALIYDQGGKAGSADTEFESALSKMMGLGIPFDTALFQLDYARSSLRRGKTDKAKRLFNEAIRCFTEAGSTVFSEQARKELVAIA
jgi:tetratricopeptide (TPR) repeat protein